MPGSEFITLCAHRRRSVLCLSMRPVSLALIAAGSSLLALPARAADVEDCRKLFLTGRYEECREVAAKALADRAWGETWHLLQARSELATGRLDAARTTTDAALTRYSRSIQIRLLAFEVYRRLGEPERARELLLEIDTLAVQAPWRYTDVDDLVALGRAALLVGADARDVLDGFYDRARRLDPDRREPYLAIGELALAKHDAQLAAEIFEEAAQRITDDADIHFGLARAYALGDAKRSAAELDKALALNPRHVPALLFQVDGLIDSEKYAEADALLDRILEINPRRPEAWAYRAVLAHLLHDPKGEAAFHAAAQGQWKRDPAVEHLIGRKLSQHYRFAEGAAYQRRALEFDPSFDVARSQLAQDLLRLGREEEGWELAETAHENDGYEVATFNLLELRDRIAKFRTLENEHFIVRMDAREAAIYGDRVLALLGRARRTLCEKYELDLTGQITVEIFPDENDFAVRTFGLPAVSGYLGVCFGRVITANSPASQGEHPANWEAVLWHEFCHVVTLELTRNKMPRWLSEGISVYEERQENATWGQRMTPRYREMILGGELVPIGQLSSAFLNPKTPFHVQFAYFESSLVVEYLIETYGLEALKAILRDLSVGLPINEALPRHTDYLENLEADFEAWAKAQADALAPQADWAEPDLAALLNDDGDALGEWLEEHPNSFAGLTAHARSLIEQQRWDDAIAPLEKLVALCPSYTGSENAYETLGRVYREIGDAEKERNILALYGGRSADSVSVFLRLIELETAARNWPAVAENARRMLAVNPLLPQPWRALGEAAERLGHTDEALAAWRALLAMEPGDPAEIHFRLAGLLRDRDAALAKRHVLRSLEEAPRFRDAHRLLLEIHRQGE